MYSHSFDLISSHLTSSQSGYPVRQDSTTLFVLMSRSHGELADTQFGINEAIIDGRFHPGAQFITSKMRTADSDSQRRQPVRLARPTRSRPPQQACPQSQRASWPQRPAPGQRHAHCHHHTSNHTAPCPSVHWSHDIKTCADVIRKTGST